MEHISQENTALSSPFGSFKGLGMPRGLTSSPNTIQNLMEHVLAGVTWKTTVPYVND